MIKHIQILLLIFLFAFINTRTVSAQEQYLDSLLAVWKDQTQTDSTRVKAYVDYIWDGFIDSDPDSAELMAENLNSFAVENKFPLAQAKSFNILGHINNRRSNFSVALKAFKQTLEIYKALGNKVRISQSLIELGEIYKVQGYYSRALEYFEQSLKIEEELGRKVGISHCMTSIGNIYITFGNSAKSLEYHQQSLKISEALGNKKGIGISLMNTGLAYSDQGNYTLALEHFERSKEIAEELGVKFGVAVGLSNIGRIFEKQRNYSGALENYKQALKIVNEIDDKPRIVNTLINIGYVYHIQGNNLLAINFCKKAFALAEEIQILGNQQYACECLYNTYKAMGNDNKALVYLEKMHFFKDSINKEETAIKLQQMEFSKQVFSDSLAVAEKERIIEAAHQEEVQKKNRIRNALAVGGFLVLMLAGTIYGRLRYTHKAKAIIEKEKDRSENLLLNILPAEIAEELKANGEARARDFDKVSILFTDFKEFTQLSEKLSAKELVEELNCFFKVFDSICEKYKIEKIKTLGDSFMAAGGLPVPGVDSAKNVVLAALDMVDFVIQRKKERKASLEIPFEMRAGIHTGSVVAGIVGVKKFQYDIWGDTVNTASRMESHGEVGRVNISKKTYDLIKNDPGFKFESRGKIEAKGKGKIEMYFVSKS